MELQVRDAEPTDLRAAFALWSRAESARMNVDPANDRARALYERHGWRHLGETEKADGTGVAELIYRVDLESAGTARC